jgi:hypothetical protein
MTTTALGITTETTGPRSRVVPQSPPTLFARQAAPQLVEAGYDLARRAIGKALERVPFDQAVRSLTELAERRDDVLRMAQDFLGYATFEVPLAAQADALALVERARAQVADQPRRAFRRRS